MRRDRLFRTIGGATLGALVALAVAWFAWPDESTDDRREAIFPIARVMPDQSVDHQEGDPCSFDTDIGNQLIVMRLDGELLGWYQPTSGTIARYGDEEQEPAETAWVCETIATMDLPEPSVPYYLVQVNRGEPLLQRAELHYAPPGTAMFSRTYRWEDAPAYPPRGATVEEVGS